MLRDPVAAPIGPAQRVAGIVLDATRLGCRIELEDGRCGFLPVHLRLGSQPRPGDRVGGLAILSEHTTGSLTLSQRPVGYRSGLGSAAGADLARSSRQPAPGDVLTGVVREVREFGALITARLEGDQTLHRGLIPTAELAWGHVPAAAGVVSEGQVVTVKLLDAEDRDGRTRLRFSLRALCDDPWLAVRDRLPAGAEVVGRIVGEGTDRRGVHIEIEPGLTGYVPIRLLVEARVPHHAAGLGMPLRVRIVNLDPDRHSLTLQVLGAGEPRPEQWGRYRDEQTGSRD